MPKKRKAQAKGGKWVASKKADHDDDDDGNRDDKEGSGDDGQGAQDGEMRSLMGVVKVFCSTTRPSSKMPWQVETQRSYTGSGCLLSGRRILTNAHVVSFGTTITLLKHGNPKRFLCRIVSFGHEYDLALLQVVEDADEFWEGVVPLKLGDLPPLNSVVLILGYPTNVDSVSVTEGVISRVMADAYSQSSEVLLKLQVDAAINPGNSGGPALVNGKLIGIVAEVQKDSQNIGFAIPAEVVQHFLQQVKKAKVVTPDQHYPGICTLGINWSNCDNPSQRAFYKLDKKEHGIVVVGVLPLSDCKGILMPEDVLMAIDDAPLADDGTIELRKSGERVRWTHAVSRKFAHDKVTLLVKRGGKTVSLVATLSGVSARFAIGKQVSRPPYVVFGGLVFLECSSHYLEDEFAGEDDTIDFNTMPLNLQVAWYRTEKKTHDQQIVILSQILCDSLCLGYTNFKNRVVEKVNGTAVNNLQHLSTLLSLGDAGDRSAKDEKQAALPPFITIELDQGQKIVLDAKKTLLAQPEIIKRNNIHPPFSLCS